MKRILVTGGAGYVGSHACKAFHAAGWEVFVFDNLSRGWRDAVRWGPLIEGDLLDRSALAAAIEQTRPDVVAHFAALAYVGESVSNPAAYYRNNCVGSLNLLEAMAGASIDRLIFSSTCASYGHPVQLPIDESHPQAPINPYGWSKLFVERMIADHGHAHGLRSVTLRYFNAAGGDLEGEIGERHEPETHLLPLAIEAALSGSDFTVNGIDFETPDGSAVRDFVHVSDLADAHVLAAAYLRETEGVHVFNLGTGQGTSVLEILAVVERLSGRSVRTMTAQRRIGDPAALVASAEKAKAVLGWTPQRSDMATIVQSAMDWHRRAPTHARS